MSNLKLGVEVVSANNILPKDSQGPSSVSVELQFDGQKFRTSAKENDPNPVWNETFYFNISDPHSLTNETLEARVYNNGKNSVSKSCLGKVRIAGTSFVTYPDAIVLHYPLEKVNMLSRARGELSLKVFITDDPSGLAAPRLSSLDTSSHISSLSSLAEAATQHSPEPVEDRKSSGKASSRHTFHSIPKSDHQPQHSQASNGQQPAKHGVDQMRSEPQGPKFMRMPIPTAQPVDFSLKETNPVLGGGKIVGGRVIPSNRPATTYDLVEPMQFLFVRVVKARNLPPMDLMTRSLDPYVEVRIGNYKGVTKHYDKVQDPEWNAVFAFAKEKLQSSVLEVLVKDKDLIKDDFVGLLRFDLRDIPTRVPPDSPLAPEWYWLEDKKGDKKKGELMLAVWMGSQADEAFPDAWHTDGFSVADSSVPITHFRSKVYHSPRLWYIRVNVIEAQDLIPSQNTRFLNVCVRAQIANQVFKTKPVQTQTMNAFWNEDTMFVTAEPFEDHLILSIEDRVGHNKDEVLGKVKIPLQNVEKRVDDRPVHGRWFNLHKPDSDHLEEKNEKIKDKFASRLHLRVCLEGGYHVLDESTHYSSDLRPTAKQLWKSPVGILELGILNANGLQPVKSRDEKGISDSYCVAKYGHKWIRTRTIVDSQNPKYNEQYTWEVFDPATVLTVGVFDNGHIGDSSNGNKDIKIGKVRIRISTLETGRVYTHTYPLLILHPSGVKKMGELHLAIRFSCTSMVNLMFQYSKPLLPKMHYARPLSIGQLDMLRYQAVNTVAARLSRAEPPLKKEVVAYMTDANSHLWSMRRSKANFYRLISLFTGLVAVTKWFGEVCKWKNPITTVLVHVLFVMLVCFPELIFPTVFLYMFLIGIWNYRYRPRDPPHMDTKISYAEAVHPDELDEEFDTFPTGRNPDLVRVRYDRLRTVAGKIQAVAGDIATQGERIQALLGWRDPRATALFLTFCLIAAIVLYATPFQVLAAFGGFYVMRHPKFRNKLPSAPLNFFRRLPARTDSML